MKLTNKSRHGDNKSSESLKRDAQMSIGDVLRTAREGTGLRQQDLAARLGLHQRQISDLERLAMDPRLSTVQDVARALDLEVMLIPRHLIATVEGLQRGDDHSNTPMYTLPADGEESDLASPSSNTPR